MAVTEEAVLKTLEKIQAPKSGQSIVEAGMVSSIQISTGGDVLFLIEVDPEKGAALETLRLQAEKSVSTLKGVQKVTAILTAERQAANNQTRTAPPDPHGMEKNPKLLVNANRIIAVSSGKGGVGKSTISAAIARKLAKNSQYKVGILDADIYGPSQPKIFGLEGQKPEFTNEKKIIPLLADGVRVMSIGFMVDNQKALVWRGPMVQSAIYQLFRDVEWASAQNPLDFLIVDMPPGTGDAQLTIAQKIDVDGAIIVSTPQDIALADARKGVEMYRTTGVPILGVIENMSTHICTNCGHEEHIFGHGGAQAEAEKLGVPFLGEIPLSADIRKASDAGKPHKIPDSLIPEILNQLKSK